MTRLNEWIKGLPVHLVLLGLCAIWIIPAFGLLITSLRPFQDVSDSGWWTVLSPPTGSAPYAQACAGCHGADGKMVPEADLSNPETVSRFRRSITLLAALKRDRKDQPGTPHMGDHPVPDDQTTADIANYLRRISGIEARPTFTLNNYIDALVGYRGTTNYVTDCAAGTQSTDLKCDISDLGNSRGMGTAFINSLLVAIPSTLLPILFAAFAAYAMAWMHFPGRQFLFAVLVALQIVPLQMTLIPISKLYAQLNMNGTFLGIWRATSSAGYRVSCLKRHTWMARITGRYSGGWRSR
jgi:alpha-glucoside transport system permease protein